MKIKRFCSSRGSKSFHCVHRGRRSALIPVNSCGFGQSVLTAFSYLTTINRSLLNVPMSHFLLSCHTCSIYRPFNHLLIFQQTLTRFSNSCGVCSFPQDPVLWGDWKSAVRLGRRMSWSTFRTCLSDARHILCWGFTPPFPHFTVASFPSISWPTSPYPLSFFLSLFYFSLVICPFHRSLLHFLNLPQSFLHPTLPLWYF